MNNNFENIKDIPIPNDLSSIEKIEFQAFQSSLIDLEEEWIKLKNNENTDQLTCLNLIKEIKEKRIEQANERKLLRIEIIEKQYQKEKERIEQEKEEYKKILFDRIVKSYYQSYLNVTSQLKELLGKDYNQFISNYPIEWPQFINENNMKTRLQQNEDIPNRQTPADCEQDIKKIQQIILNNSFENKD